MTNLTASPKDAAVHAAGSINVARRLTEMARQMPDAVAVVVQRPSRFRKTRYETHSFAQLEAETNALASGLRALGVQPRERIALLVRPSWEFVSLVFALLKSGAVTILIDPGMGRRNLIGCLEQAQPDGFVAVPVVHAIRRMLARRFPRSKHHVTVGRRPLCGAVTLETVRGLGSSAPYCHDASPDDPAAIIFTSGSTGPPKGVLYHHEIFDRQVVELGEHYGIQPGDVDLAGFPLFGLFNAALGVTTLIPDMDAARPARVDPAKIVAAIHDWRATQSFGSPAIWNRVGQYCQRRNIQLPSLERVISAGAPVPPDVLARMKGSIGTRGDIHTPYGATEALPVASIAASEILTETRHAWAKGAGTCVGRRFPGIDWKIIAITDEPIARIDDAIELPPGEIGELIVSGPVVTREYVTRREANAMAKIGDGSRVWHRMGDVGYVDPRGRFWFCGRKAQRVTTPQGTMFTIPCEAVFNQHPLVYRSALVGLGTAPNQRPAIVVEPQPGKLRWGRGRRALLTELRSIAAAHPHTASIRDFLVCRSMPVDVRHNAKIGREQLAVWATRKLR
jgi:acyl-CoA synthetase (AMP-forming)/AMP-acid ligase II